MNSRTKRSLVIALIACVLIVAGGFAAYRGYIYARQTRLLKQAHAYLAKHNDTGTRKAVLCLQRVLRTDPGNIEACRLMADLNEAARSQSALLWRTRVVEANPHSVEDRLALAQTALVLRNFGIATNALEAVSPAGQKTAAYQNLAGTIAAATGQPALAEAHFVEAIRLEPRNAVPQLNLAVVRLLSTNQATLAEARATLTWISSNPTNGSLRCQALRELTNHALRNRQTETALALSKQLLLETNSVFADHLLRLNVLQQTRNPEFKSTLSESQRDAAPDPAKTYELTAWMMVKTSPAQALAWVTNVPATTRSNQTVAMVIADCYSAQQDWSGLMATLDPQRWGELDFIRCAFMARALRGEGLAAAAKGEWELALKATGNQKDPMIKLLRIAAQWRWQSETEDLLWNFVNRYPEERWAFATLSQALYAGGRTRPLLMLFTQQNKRLPADLDTKNSLAMTALLLEAKEVNPYALAREVYQQAPTNAYFASTYAFSLYKQDKTAEALKIMQQLKPAELERPSIAGYYGLILKASGDTAKAKSYLGWASKAQLLPEEQKLFDRARAGV
jgi:cytochrome c-type biogenesis protein CcmH/NrfG